MICQLILQDIKLNLSIYLIILPFLELLHLDLLLHLIRKLVEFLRLQVTLLDLIPKRLKKRQVNLYTLLLLRVLSLFILALLSLLAEVWILFQHFLHLVDLVLVVEAMLRLQSSCMVDYLQGLVDGV